MTRYEANLSLLLEGSTTFLLTGEKETIMYMHLFTSLYAGFLSHWNCVQRSWLVNEKR